MCLNQTHPIACDPKYGVEEFDRKMKEAGLNRLFLHAASIEFDHPKTGERTKIEAPLEKPLHKLLASLPKKPQVGKGAAGNPFSAERRRKARISAVK